MLLAPIDRTDDFVFITPEYNHGLPASIKKAIDVVSRTVSESYMKGKPYLIVITQLVMCQALVLSIIFVKVWPF